VTVGTRTLVELCAGTASVSLYALGRAVPLTGYMGSKRRWASDLVQALDCDAPDRVVLVDAGPWGDAWSVLRDPLDREYVAAQLDAWDRDDLAELWQRLNREPPSAMGGRRVAQFLWLQARSAGCVPVWWSVETGRWESPTGSKTEAAHTRGGGALLRREKGAESKARSSRLPGPAYEAGRGERQRQKESTSNRATRGGAAAPKGRCRGIQYPSTVAARVRALGRLPWDRIEVVHGDARTVDPIPGATVLFDPPYFGAPRYAALFPRSDVLLVGQRWADRSARVAICEREPLPLPGWTSRRLADREVLTASWPIPLAEQLDLW
jgi:hypothetical protein